MCHENDNLTNSSNASTSSTNGQAPAGSQPASQQAGASPYSGYAQPSQGASPAPYSNYQQGYPASQPVQQTSYSWGPQPPYYAQPQPPKPKKKRSPGKTAAKAVAAVLACAVVSMGSVGAFAAMIQSGVVDVRSPEGAEKTAAFTLYKKDESSVATPTSTREGMSTQEVAQKLIPSVVCVQNYQVVQQSMDDLFGGFGYFFGGQGGQGGQGQQGGELSPAGEGSGIVISKDGYIVTNQHVISGASNIKVVTSDGATYEAELIGEDTQTDLAVIKINAETELVPAEFGDSEDLQVTDQVLAIGNPGGLQFNSSVTIGYVSALNRPVTNGETGFVVNCIQTDAAINPGNSGGALVNSDGLVVGINSSKIAKTDYEGMGFAIPSSVAQPIVSDLIEHGYVTSRPMLGIMGGYVDRTLSSFYRGLPQGYYVAEVTSDEAKASGLQQYDTITAIDDVQVTSENTIASYIANKKPGDKVTLTVDRPLAGQTGLKIELVLSANTGMSRTQPEAEAS